MHKGFGDSQVLFKVTFATLILFIFLWLSASQCRHKLSDTLCGVKFVKKFKSLGKLTDLPQISSRRKLLQTLLRHSNTWCIVPIFPSEDEGNKWLGAAPLTLGSCKFIHSLDALNHSCFQIHQKAMEE
ncbi:hypothetical protein RHGRI_028504 [Rhododendron griersonianum]|uniref:Uncharacterized protein n=1 Tax=Rhododendron griersonianum TaxID=479676 RepID=A0AAV6IG17_9ERIC|nr:hypothetical protein RHGRI_028504 [Rhododendron griersonianum]